VHRGQRSPQDDSGIFSFKIRSSTPERRYAGIGGVDVERSNLHAIKARFRGRPPVPPYALTNSVPW